MTEMTTPTTDTARPSRIRTAGRKLLDRPETGLFLAWLLLILLLDYYADFFLTLDNMVNIMRDSSILFIASAGMTIAMIAGGLDLSVASVMAIAGVVMGRVYSYGMPVPVALLAGLATGPAIGSLNGLLITRGRINPLIATLGTMGVFRGLAFIWTEGRTIPIHDVTFRFARARPWGIPLPIFFMVGVLILAYYVLSHTKFGRHLYAVGGNASAARQSALDVGHHRRLMYLFSASLAALAGVLWASVLGLQDPRAAMGSELEVATAVLLGGATLSGGGGSIQGTFIAVLLITSMNNGLIGLGMHPAWQYVIRGGLLLAAVIIGEARRGGYR